MLSASIIAICHSTWEEFLLRKRRWQHYERILKFGKEALEGFSISVPNIELQLLLAMCILPRERFD